MKFSVLGCRGSVTRAAKNFIEYGGDTSCYLAETDMEALFLDAGSGMVNSGELCGKRISVVLSHFHLDHIQGLPFFKKLFTDTEINIFTCESPETTKKLLDGIFSPPYWPVKMEDYPATVKYLEIKGEIKIGNITLKAMEGNHPDGSYIYRIECGDSSIVYATDYEYSTESFSALTEFSRDAGLLIFDGQYTQEEAKNHPGYGHSTKECGLKLLEASGAKKIMFCHYDPWHDDDFLASEEKRIKGIDSRAYFAKPGMVIEV